MAMFHCEEFSRAAFDRADKLSLNRAVNLQLIP